MLQTSQDGSKHRRKCAWKRRCTVKGAHWCVFKRADLRGGGECWVLKCSGLITFPGVWGE